MLFGPVGNSKLVFYFIHLMYLVYGYPLYVLLVFPTLWPEHKFINVLFFLATFTMWYALYTVHLTDPGYLKQNTPEYQTYLRKLTFRSESFVANDWSKSLARLCHTCKTIKPYRASHCRACNRCVLAFDHHCPYIQNCVGYKNRPYFFLFVVSMCTLQIISIDLLYLCLSIDVNQYIIYPALFMACLFAFMTAILTFGAVSSFSIFKKHYADNF